jgi:hypothetical protein
MPSRPTDDDRGGCLISSAIRARAPPKDKFSRQSDTSNDYPPLETPRVLPANIKLLSRVKLSRRPNRGLLGLPGASHRRACLCFQPMVPLVPSVGPSRPPYVGRTGCASAKDTAGRWPAQGPYGGPQRLTVHPLRLYHPCAGGERGVERPYRRSHVSWHAAAHARAQGGGLPVGQAAWLHLFQTGRGPGGRGGVLPLLRRHGGGVHDLPRAPGPGAHGYVCVCV